MIDQGHLRNGEIEMQRDDTISAHGGVEVRWRGVMALVVGLVT
jgi:hypothetical protein